MKAELTDISEVKKRLDIEIPEDVVSAEITTIAREFAKRARVPGFRPGKAPLGVVKNRYKDDILSELYQHLLPRYFHDAVQEKSLEVVEASTTFEPPAYANGQPLSFQVGFEVFPSFEIEDYSEIPVEEVPTEVTDEEIEEYLGNVVEERAEMTPVEEDRPLQAGDFAEITFSGALVGGGEGEESSEELSGEKALCEIGGETTVKEFTENLTGASPGDERSFEVVYREDHPEKRLAGKTAHYNVKVEGIKEKKRPELNDEFAQGLGDYKTLDDLRDEVRKNMEAHRKEHADQQMRDSLLRWLENNNEFEVPDSLVEQQLQVRLERLMRNLTQQGMNPRSLDIDWDKIRNDQYGQAVRDVRGLLILEHLAEKENVAVTDADIDREIQTMAEGMQQPAPKVREVLSRNDGIDRMRGQIRNNKILELLEGRAKLVPPGSLTSADTSEEGPVAISD